MNPHTVGAGREAALASQAHPHPGESPCPTSHARGRVARVVRVLGLHRPADRGGARRALVRRRVRRWTPPHARAAVSPGHPEAPEQRGRSARRVARPYRDATASRALARLALQGAEPFLFGKANGEPSDSLVASRLCLATHCQGVNVVTVTRQLGHFRPQITLRVNAHLFGAGRASGGCTRRAGGELPGNGERPIAWWCRPKPCPHPFRGRDTKRAEGAPCGAPSFPLTAG